jgi:hypothetical protein
VKDSLGKIVYITNTECQGTKAFGVSSQVNIFPAFYSFRTGSARQLHIRMEEGVSSVVGCTLVLQHEEIGVQYVTQDEICVMY